MPQAAAGTWRTHAMQCLYGKGSLHADLLESTFRTRHRADRRNNEARHRLRLLARSLERSRREEDARSTTELAKARRAADEIVAYREVLKSYAADKLWTLRPGFRPSDLATSDPAVLRRYRLERRLYSRGYGVETLYPEVLKAMRELNWENRTRKVHERNVTEEDPVRNKDKLLGDFDTVTTTTTSVKTKDDEKSTRLFHLDVISPPPPPPTPHRSDFTVADGTKQQTPLSSGRCSAQLPPIGRSSKDVVAVVDVVPGRRRSSAVVLEEIQSQGQAAKKRLPSISTENAQSNLVIRQTFIDS